MESLSDGGRFLENAGRAALKLAAVTYFLRRVESKVPAEVIHRVSAGAAVEQEWERLLTHLVICWYISKITVESLKHPSSPCGGGAKSSHAFGYV